MLHMLQSGEIVSSKIRFEANTVAQCRAAQNASLLTFSLRERSSLSIPLSKALL